MVANIYMIGGKITLIGIIIGSEHIIRKHSKHAPKIRSDGVRFLLFKRFSIKYRNCLGVKNKVFSEEREISLRDLEKNISVNLLPCLLYTSPSPRD